MTDRELDAFAVAGGRVVWAGSGRDIATLFPASDILDFGDAVIVPGFNDAHIHLAGTASDLLQTDLSPAEATTIPQLQEKLRRAVAETPAGTWILGNRYDDSRFPGGRGATRWDLDAVSAVHPILVTHIAGHWAVVNSAALAVAGIDEASTAPLGGAYGRDAAGTLNGILYEHGFTALFSPGWQGRDEPLIPTPPFEDRLRALQRAVRMFHSAGLTSVGEAYATREDVALFHEALRRDTLTLRVNFLIAHTDYDSFRDEPVADDADPTRLRFDGVKAFVDGAIGGRTCLLTEPFEGTTDDYGIQTMSSGDLWDTLRRVHGDGRRMAVHANGDRAISILLDQYERAQAAFPGASIRPRIEHCTIVNEDILARMHRVGAIAVPFGSYVDYYGGKLLDWYGPKRVSRMFAHRSFLDGGIGVLGSSDYPCGPYEPLRALQSCVTRTGVDGEEIGSNQRISAREALELYTVAPAEASGQSDIKGRLSPGYLADFVVLGDDPLQVEPRRIASIPVLATYVGGQRVWPHN